MQPSEFKIRIDDIANKLEKNGVELVKKVALAVDQAVVLSTPVDTGRARSNWLVSVDNPEERTVETYGESSASKAISQGSSEINSFGESNKAIYITNNLPYIQRLNDGYSAQAPAGFVEKSLQAGIEAARAGRLL